MLETILITALSSALILKSSSFTPKSPTPHIAFTQVLPEKNFVSYAVEKDDTLSTISQKYYGTEDHWTMLWNDNSSIADPEILEEGKLLNVRAEKSDSPELLHSELAQKEAHLITKKNEKYLEDIGYEKVKQPETPASQPKQAVIVVAESFTPSPVIQISVIPQNNSSTISEEAITYLGNCEAGMDPAKNTGNGYYGAFQFSASTWRSMNTGYERADLAPIEVQKAAVQQLLQRSSIYTQFPGCANKMRSAKII